MSNYQELTVDYNKSTLVGEVLIAEYPGAPDDSLAYFMQIDSDEAARLRHLRSHPVEASQKQSLKEVLATRRPYIAGVGALATSGATESVTGSSFIDGAVFGLTFLGGMKLQKSARNRKTKQTIAEHVTNHHVTGEGIALPNTPVSFFLHSEAAQSVLTRQFTFGYEDMRVTGSEVLAWLQKRSYAGLPLSFNNEGVTATGSVLTTVRLNSSLYELYREAFFGRSIKTGSLVRDKEYDCINTFDSQREKFADQLGLKTERTPLVLGPADMSIDQSRNALFKATARVSLKAISKLEDVAVHFTWKDAACTFVRLAPSEFIRDMLASDPNPTELWESITEELEKITTIHASRQSLRARAAQLKNIDALTNTVSPTHSKESQIITAQLQQTANDLLQPFLAVAATVMVRQRKQKIMEKHETLLADMAESYDKPDLESALKLYDLAITAIAVSKVPADELDKPEDHLKQYLQEAVKLADGSSETFRRLLEGMRTKFPYLRLPAHE